MKAKIHLATPCPLKSVLALAIASAALAMAGPARGQIISNANSNSQPPDDDAIAGATNPLPTPLQIAQQAYLKASNTGADDNFYAVAVSGDTVVVGAIGEDSSATGVNGNQSNNSTVNSGAAYVFVRHGTNWTQQAYLKASNTGAEDRFGQSVAISGDTVVVGAPSDDSNATGVNGNQSNNSAERAGAAYVFVRSGTTWSQQAYLKASNSGAFDDFGSSVAISGDTVVVGALHEDSNDTGVDGNQANNNALSSGAAYVFVRSGTTWTQQAYLKASNTGVDDGFGSSVAVSGGTVVVGAWLEDSNATGVNGNQSDNSAEDSGAAYVFVRSGTTWSQRAYLKASNTGIGGMFSDRFGTSVAMFRDTVVIGAYGEDSNATGVNGNQSNNSAEDSGAAYVFVRSGTTWTQEAYLKASNTGASDFFGIRVAVSSDTVLVGAYWEDSNATGVNGEQGDNSAFNSGAAYVFTGLSIEPPTVLLTSPTNNAIFIFPANLQLTASASGGNIAGAEFFAGGASLGTVTSAPYSLIWSNATPGDYVLTAVATDSRGLMATSAPVHIRVLFVNQAPSFTKGADQMVFEDAGPQAVANWAANITAGPAHESDQMLSFLVSNDNPTLFAVQPAINPAGTLTYTPAPNASGSATVTVLLRDNGGTDNGGQDTSAPQTFLITVTPVNDAPVAFPQSLSVNEDTPLAITLTASDVDGDALTYLLTPPSHGILSGAPPHLTYTPAANYFGPDSFSFKVNDGQLDSEPATVSINVISVNDPPVAAASISPQVLLSPEGPPVVISPNNVDALVVLDASASSDVENDPLHFSWFIEGASEPFATGMVINHTFELGEYAIILHVSDGTDVATARLSLLVISPGQAVELLTALVDDAPLERKNKRPLIATLKAAAAAFDRGDLIPALNQLRAFQNKVRAQITRDNPAEADAFIQAAQLVLDQFQF